MILKLSAVRNRTFSFGGTSITVLTVTISKDGGAFAAPAGALANITGTYYKLSLTAADTDTLGDLAYKFSDSIIGVIFPDSDDVDEVCPDLPGVLADGVAHGGIPGSSTATLALQSVYVQSTGSTAAVQIYGADSPALELGNTSTTNQAVVEIITFGTTGSCLYMSCNSATDACVLILAGSGAPALSVFGPFTTSAPALLIDNLPADTGGAGGAGISIKCSGGNAIDVSVVGGADALSLIAADGGQGIQAKGANGISAISTGGGGSGIFAHGDTTAPGIDALGGATSGVGIRAKSGTGSNAAGMLIQGDGGGDGLDILGGSTSGLGLFAQGFGTHGGIVAQGGATGAALQLIGGATSGAGIKVTTVNGNGIDLTGAAGAGKSGFAGTLDSTAVNSITQTALTESYAANGAAFTLTQALYEICQGITQFSIAGVTITAQKRDHATTAMTFTMDSATAPTSRTRAS